jgi:hypothetical protein
MSQIYDRIHSDPKFTDALERKNLDDLASLASDDDSILESEGRVFYKQTAIGFGGIMAILGPVRGTEVLDILEGQASNNRLIKRAFALIERGVLDLSIPTTRAEIDSLVGTIITQDEADTLKNSAKVLVPYSRLEIEAEIFNPDGSLK